MLDRGNSRLYSTRRISPLGEKRLNFEFKIETQEYTNERSSPRPMGVSTTAAGNNRFPTINVIADLCVSGHGERWKKGDDQQPRATALEEQRCAVAFT